MLLFIVCCIITNSKFEKRKKKSGKLLKSTLNWLKNQFISDITITYNILVVSQWHCGRHVLVLVFFFKLQVKNMTFSALHTNQVKLSKNKTKQQQQQKQKN